MFTVWQAAASLIHYSFLNSGKAIVSEKYAQQIDETHRKLQHLQLAFVNRKGRILLHIDAQLLGAKVRYSAHDKGHEEGGSTYAKAGSSLRSPPGNPRASTPITRACLLYYFVLLPTPLTLRGAVPHHLFQRRS